MASVTARVKFPRRMTTLKPKAKKAAPFCSDDREHETPVVTSTAPQIVHDPTRIVFGVDLDDPRDAEDDMNALVPVAKFVILAMICLMSFSIRLFAVVRYESVCIHRYDLYLIKVGNARLYAI